jgi:photosystem II stability/assembly factor-like uncharacterized protein
MKSVVVAGLGLALACAAQAAQVRPEIEVQVSGTAHQALFALDFEGQRGIAVGAHGEAQITEDGGKTWKPEQLPTTLALLGIDTESDRTLAVGQSGAVVLKNGDSPWELVSSGTDKRLFSVSTNTAGLSVAVGEFGAIQLSEDGGRSWHGLTLDWMAIGTDGGVEPHLYSVNVGADGSVTVVGEFGLIMRSADKGRSWTVQSRGVPSLFDIQIRDNGVGFAVGQDGYALKTTDHGVSWTCLNTGSDKAILNGVYSSPDGRVVVTAMREMIVSNDDGATWSAVDNTEIATVWYVGVGSAGQEVLAVGQAGRIIRVGS